MRFVVQVALEEAVKCKWRNETNWVGQAEFVKIYMLLIDDERFLLLRRRVGAGRSTRTTAEPTPSAVAASANGFTTVLKNSRRRGRMPARVLLYWMRRAWDWLHTLVRPDEAMLARLRRLARIKLHHPAARSEVDVRASWRNYLARQWRRHFFWLVFNAVIAPAAALLSILPGPNVIGFWFAYRAIHHGIVVWGITRARRNLIPIELHPVAIARSCRSSTTTKERPARRARRCRRTSSTSTWRGGAARSSGMPAKRPRQRRATAAPHQSRGADAVPEDPETGDHAPSEL